MLAGTNHPTGPHKFSVVVDACAAPGNKASPALFLCFRSVLYCRQYNTKKESPEFVFVLGQQGKSPCGDSYGATWHAGGGGGGCSKGETAASHIAQAAMLQCPRGG